ncbi:hypothetical protein BDEG_28316 [Batrachochytrium dendrobatidis JEL423]|uniref:Peptidase A1 domain-containing protein n=1 Tax=Batrachochytrium dendrobatidis (strain JEL423) TaxID=403673 RepID=A0A177WZT7_BATDL|nr:hypothetical protein BDEG_28316 [Batrachochytrium dendrobatidis JEL423]
MANSTIVIKSTSFPKFQVMLRYILLSFQVVTAVRVSLLDSEQSSAQLNGRLSKRSPLPLNGDASKCFQMKIQANGINLNVLVDSATSDLIVPLSTLNNYRGPTLPDTKRGEPVSGSYGSGATWKGYGFLATVNIPDTGIIATNSPTVGIYQQSIEPTVISGEPRQGVFGFAYPSLSYYHTSPESVMDAWYKSKTILKNQVATQLCPYGLSEKSYIDIGNTDSTKKCGTNGESVAWVYSPSLDFFTVSIRNILVNDRPVTLPVAFKENEFQQNSFSYIDTCSRSIRLPHLVLDGLIGAITASRAFQPPLTTMETLAFFWQRDVIDTLKYTIDWKKLPTLSFVLDTGVPKKKKGSYSTVKITLGPKDYLQQIGPNQYLFSVGFGSETSITLGIPFMTRLKVVFDREGGRIGFGPGCGCDTPTDGYPTIMNERKVLWPLPRSKWSRFKHTVAQKLSELYISFK